MRLRWWSQERTFVLTWDDHIVVGLTGWDRPSVLWHIKVWWNLRGAP